MAQTCTHDNSVVPDAASGHFSCLARNDGKLFGQPTAARAPQSGLADGYDPRRDPEKDLAAARAEAKKNRKNIFVEVGGEWCTWCHILDRFFDEHPNLEALRDKNYVPMEVSMSQESSNRAFLSRFPYIHGYPHIFILDAEGELIRSQPTCSRMAVVTTRSAFRDCWSSAPRIAARSVFKRFLPCLTLPSVNPRIEGPNVAGVAHW